MNQCMILILVFLYHNNNNNGPKQWIKHSKCYAISMLNLFKLAHTNLLVRMSTGFNESCETHKVCRQPVASLDPHQQQIIITLYTVVWLQLNIFIYQSWCIETPSPSLPMLNVLREKCAFESSIGEMIWWKNHLKIVAFHQLFVDVAQFCC